MSAAITWNGWTFFIKKNSFWKNRHNPAFKNNVEKVCISEEEYKDAVKKWEEVFEK